MFVPTIDRPSLARTLKSLECQTYPGFSVRVDRGPEPFLDKTLRMARDSGAELVAICDDDAEFPPRWLEGLVQYFDSPSVSFVGGPMIPLITDSSSRTEKAAAFVSQSFVGSLWMARRSNEGAFAEQRTETGIVGVGVYRRETLKRALEEGGDKIPRGAWETYVFTKMKEWGYRTIFAPEGRFYHSPRSSFRQLARQAFRSGVGRMAVFRTKPRMAMRIGSLVLPMFALAYFIEASAHAFYWPAVVYVGLVFVAGGFDLWNFAAILIVHASYTSGLLVGLFRRHASWT